MLENTEGRCPICGKRVDPSAGGAAHSMACELERLRRLREQAEPEPASEAHETLRTGVEP